MPQEMSARRDQDEWDVANGYRSTVDVYMDRHPGTSREDAIASLARVRMDESAIAREVAAAEVDPLGLDAIDTAIDRLDVPADEAP